MPIEPSQLITRVQSLAPFEDEDAARRACDATLMALRRGLTDDEADWLALDLGPALASTLLRGTPAADASLDGFHYWVSRLAGQRRSVACEQAQVVCRVLTELLSPSASARLRRCLPELRDLFALPGPEQPASGPHRLRADPAPDHSLAGGAPGSERPLYAAQPQSDAQTPDATASAAHRHSVAAASDPHGDSKLSSARGF